MNTINIGDRGNVTSYFQDIPPSPQPSVQSFEPFDYVNLPKDLQRLVLSFCDAETKCELIAVSHFTSNYIARDKVKRAVDSIFKSPHMKQHLDKKQIGVQQLVDHVFERFRVREEGCSHQVAFMRAVCDFFIDYQPYEEELCAFIETLWNAAGQFKTSI